MLLSLFPPPQTVGPCAVQNPTAPSTSRGKSCKVHWESGLGHNSVFFLYHNVPIQLMQMLSRMAVLSLDSGFTYLAYFPVSRISPTLIKRNSKYMRHTEEIGASPPISRHFGQFWRENSK